MSALKMVLAGGVAAAALVSAAPASAQFYPGYGGYGYGGAEAVIGQVIGQVLSGGLGNSYGYNGYNQGYGQMYGMNQQAVVSQCAAAVQGRLAQRYGGYGAYGYNSYGGARVLGISRVEQRNGGGLNVRGVASSGRYASYGYSQTPDLTFTCRTDYRGYITDIDFDRVQSNYGYNYAPYSNYGTDYSAYGYRRY